MELQEKELLKLEEQVKQLQEQIRKIKGVKKRTLIDKLEETPITNIREEEGKLIYSSRAGVNPWNSMITIAKEVLKAPYEIIEMKSYTLGSYYTFEVPNDKQKIRFEKLDDEVYKEIINMLNELSKVYNKYYKMFHSTALVKFVDLPYSVEVKVGENLDDVKKIEFLENNQRNLNI